MKSAQRDTSPLLTPLLAARRAGVSRQSIYIWIRKGLPCEWQGLQYRIRAAALDRWIATKRAEKVRV